MATKRMLIDASHPEETRVLVVSGTRLEDYDVEVESRRPLKGNIYLAKVTRVEPSLQAAFVDFGGNRHGFLAFNEIHPDYYQIPVADREALLAEERAEAQSASDADDDANDVEEGPVETLGGDDSEEVEARRPAALRRHYKIQEVIKRRQILLVQVVKEERGTKGAALTTYLSLAGRYCVLMPNTDRGGGISRKISNAADRKRLKKVVADLGIPEGMAVIVRTAGSKRSKAEIRRDYDYLLRLWNQVREMTLNSIAPSLVHEEGDLIKRSIRDLYTKEIDEIVVHGDDGYRMAKDFMKILIPSHAKKVQKKKDDGVPLTAKFGVDAQLEAIHSPEVHMKSGAYIVINPTEALVSIDVNSGRATKERNIEETALRTNIDAAVEIARQLRLRDLAGLIVIDFIDMEVHRNQAKVERALKEAMRTDRARIQIGRISPFGLLELSRQRLRPSLIETSSEPCPYCEGTGVRRSTDTTALEVLRAIEEEGLRQSDGALTVHVPTSVALYVLNQKRQSLAELEEKYSLSVTLENDDTLIPPAMRIEREGEGEVQRRGHKADGQADTGEDAGGKRRRRRRSRRRRRGEPEAGSEDALIENFEAADGDVDGDGADADGEKREPAKRRRRGRRGGRRRRARSEEIIAEAGEETAAASEDAAAEDAPTALLEAPETTELLPAPNEDGEAIAMPDETGEAAPADKKPKRRRAAKKKDADADANSDEDKSDDKPAEEKPKRTRRKKADAEKPEAAGEPAEAETAAEAEEAPAKPKRKPRKRTAKAAVKETEPAAEPADDDAPPPESKEPVTAPEPDPAPEPVAAMPNEASKTTVVNVGASDTANPRRGWWNRDSAD
ncbi:MAG: Rne/Rng family ribonuclease [Magnetovibrio sp.]|nr:Rne/Rng family ribonuclease [Magnetovibrio sp.]